MYKIAVLCALVASCAAQVPLPTPEVAQATAAHFAAVAQAHALSAPLFSHPIAPGYAPAPVFNPAPLFDDGKYRHDPSGDYRPLIPALPPTVHMPYPYAYAPTPAPVVPLYEDGLYHTDPAGTLIHRLVPAPH